MRVIDLFEAPRRKKPFSGPGSKNHTIEISNFDGESAEIEVEFHYRVEAPEYEDGYKSYDGGVSLENTKILPFTFDGKKYTTITPEIVGSIDFPLKFEKANKALIDRAKDEKQKHPLTKKETDDLIDKYLAFVFDHYVDIDTEE